MSVRRVKSLNKSGRVSVAKARAFLLALKNQPLVARKPGAKRFVLTRDETATGKGLVAFHIGALRQESAKREPAKGGRRRGGNHGPSSGGC